MIFFWGLWSFLNNSGRWADFFLLIIYSDFFPFTSTLFLFGAGCFLIFMKEMWWKQILTIKKDMFLSKPGVNKQWQFWRWSGQLLNINKDDILTLRVHAINLDKFGVHQLEQIEVDYQSPEKETLLSVILYKDQESELNLSITRLVQDIKDILELSGEIEYTSSSEIISEKIEKKLD
jgi:hypothetical protein